MLERMRSSPQFAIAKYVLIGLVGAVFIISFGPQSRGTTCEASLNGDETAGRVGGRTISAQSFTSAFRLMEIGRASCRERV